MSLVSLEQVLLVIGVGNVLAFLERTCIGIEQRHVSLVRRAVDQ
jgi:hypothetical protein